MLSNWGNEGSGKILPCLWRVGGIRHFGYGIVNVKTFLLRWELESLGIDHVQCRDPQKVNSSLVGENDEVQESVS